MADFTTDRLRITKNQLLQSILQGIVSGMLLGGLFLAIESLAQVNVYTLLMNVDYVPGFRDWDVPAWLEFSLHLVVSIVLCVLLSWVQRWGVWGATLRTRMIRCSLAMLVVGIALFPSTLFAVTAVTPALDDVSAWTVWLVGHLMYGLYLGRFLLKD